jgi:hypothetical protein
VNYRFRLPAFAQIAGSRMLIQPRLFEAPSPFTNATRTHPIYLRRTVDRLQEVRVIPPPGFELEHALPQESVTLTLKSGNSPGVYTTATSAEAGAITHTTRLTTDASLVSRDEYASVKNFYDRVAAKERTHLVLKKR